MVSYKKKKYQYCVLIFIEREKAITHKQNKNELISRVF